jgi:neutral ceramidase
VGGYHEESALTIMRIGVAEIDYTPAPGLPLMGNFRDDYAARGVHDPLCARAFVFENSSGARAAMLSVDICMLDRANVAYIRECASRESGIAPERILVAATHTHSAPAPMPLGSLPQCEDSQTEQFLGRVAQAVPLAARRMTDAALVAGSAVEDRLPHNRRLLCKDGRTHMNWEGLDPEFVVKPLGAVDYEMRVLGVESSGATRAAMVNYALHPAILAGDNWLYSADFPGYIAAGMRQLFGQEFIAAYFNGCCGNVNHVDYRDRTMGRGYTMTERVGYMLAVGAYQALGAAVHVDGDHLAVSSERVSLTRLKIDEEEHRWCRNVVRELAGGHAPGQVDGLPDEYWAVTRLGMYEKQFEDDGPEVMVIRMGDAAVVGLPGEIFSEYGLEIKRHSPARHTFVVELANDAIGYIPTREAFAQGGYEPTPGATFYTEDAGARLTASALRQLEALFTR